MELILISESKLKVMLTKEDMHRFDITCDELDSSAIASRRAFWNILDEAKAQTGFDPAGHKIFVQMYPSRAGGCELFVTRLGGKKSARVPRMETAEIPPHPEEQSLYAFDALGDLLLACRRLSAREAPPLSWAYADEEARQFYLALGEDVPFLDEYNGKRCRPRDFAYIEEHCRLFCTDAVRILAPLA